MAKLFYYYFSHFGGWNVALDVGYPLILQIQNTWGVFMVSISKFIWIVKRMFRQLKTPKQQIQIQLKLKMIFIVNRLSFAGDSSCCSV